MRAISLLRLTPLELRFEDGLNYSKSIDLEICIYEGKLKSRRRFYNSNHPQVAFDLTKTLVKMKGT